MDEKYSRYTQHGLEEDFAYDSGKDRQSSWRQLSRRTLRSYLVLVGSIFFVVIYAIPKTIQMLKPIDSITGQQQATMKSNSTNLVPLEAHIMSKCPDAKDCLVDLVVPAMEKISDKVDFTLSYIGSIGDDNSILCKHGATECLGNMLGLCAAELFPRDVKRSLGFSTCLVMSYDEIPARDLVEQCALEHGISFDAINDCVSDEGKGPGLLEDSVKRTQKAGVTKSCTVRVANEIWCIRDGAKWKDCPEGHEIDDLVQAVNKRYKAS